MDDVLFSWEFGELVESGTCLQTMAAYIDLNPVRAGLVEKPEDYRWCGYAEALGGSKRMGQGLCRTIGWPIDHWKESDKGRESGAEAYRTMLYEKGLEREGDKAPTRRGRKRHAIKLKAVREVIEKGGQLGEAELAKHRVRWFSEGIALGSEAFLRRTLGYSFQPDAFKELPVSLDSESSLWYTLSRLRSAGIG